MCLLSYGLAFGPDGTLFVADSGNHRIRTINRNGDVRTLCGSGTPGHKDGSGTSAQFFYPVGIAVDADGTSFVTDRANHRIRKVTAKGTVSTLAGSGRNAVVDGKGAAASFAWPNAIALVSCRPAHPPSGCEPDALVPCRPRSSEPSC